MAARLNLLHRSVTDKAVYSAALWQIRAQADLAWLLRQSKLRLSNLTHCSLLHLVVSLKVCHKANRPTPSQAISQVPR
jgi:hypothetical protein